jgi:hypothetical protein
VATRAQLMGTARWDSSGKKRFLCWGVWSATIDKEACLLR